MGESKRTILVVDDERTNLVRAKNMLAEEYQTVLVNCGEQCIDYLCKHRPDLIMLDILMPGMDGWEVMKQIKANPEWEDIPVMFLTADSKPETEASCFLAGGVDFVVKPVQSVSLLSRIKRIIELEDYRKDLKGVIKEQQDRINRMQYEFMVTMADIVDNREGKAGEHVKRTADIVWLIGKELLKRGMFQETINEDYVENLRLAAPMHDIGKIKIPDTILLKPGKLTEEEYDLIKNHTLFGKDIIEDTLGTAQDKELFGIARDIATYHHEKYNGNGYPEGLKGTEIPLCARIMAIADVYDALKGKRCYKEAFPLEEVYEIMREDSGVSFDPDILSVFLEIREEIEKIG